MNARKGLKRRGIRSYEIGGWIITRDRPRRFYLRRADLADWPPDIFSIRFKRLGDARAMAEAHDGTKYILSSDAAAS